jgi:outer membrane protein OmpA-like peptidoglycan-associated protein
MLSLLTALLASSPALAADSDPVLDHHATFAVEGGWFWTDKGEHIGSSWSVVGRAGWGPVPRLGFELSTGYIQGRTRSSFEYVYSAFTPRFSTLFIILPEGRFQPFFAVEAGLIYKNVWRSQDIIAEQANAEGWGGYENPDTDFLGGAGVGVFIPLVGPLAFRADFRALVNIGTEPHGLREDIFYDLELTAGLALRLGTGSRDRDNDGILNRVDLCPDDPEDRDYFEDQDGCPDWDNDQDRLPDPIDKCPNDPEDRDGFQDGDGCPDPDNDNDGILDVYDTCPNMAEDKDGFEDEDGCPDPDNDQDGVDDLRDECPNVPEDHDGWQDQDGCPDPDNDGDGILDKDDECPNAAEDQDGFGDLDGCPENDNDGDGIQDLDDRCPSEPEDHDGFQDEDGCPDLDNDSDGIADTEDRCPDDAEDRDGFQDEDGCPELDNDQDGIPDLQDRCPLDPEDVDGFQDEDGCIDPDNDADGIPDVVDDCPDSAEVYNGFQDLDGCPDELPPEIKEFTGVIQGIYFEIDSDTIKAQSFSVLDRAARVLQDYPDVRLKIEGHTDSDGGEEHNLDLSQRRAMSVGQYLIDAGVNPDRLEWQGYGESRPIASNNTQDGKAQNRRVEFHVINPAKPQVPQ